MPSLGLGLFVLVVGENKYCCRDFVAFFSSFLASDSYFELSHQGRAEAERSEDSAAARLLMHFKTYT